MVQTAKNLQHNLTWMDFWLEEPRLRLALLISLHHVFVHLFGAMNLLWLPSLTRLYFFVWTSPSLLTLSSLLRWRNLHESPEDEMVLSSFRYAGYVTEIVVCLSNKVWDPCFCIIIFLYSLLFDAFWHKIGTVEVNTMVTVELRSSQFWFRQNVVRSNYKMLFQISNFPSISFFLLLFSCGFHLIEL